MSKFDDFVFYSPREEKIFVGRRYIKPGDAPWTWFMIDGEKDYLFKDNPLRFVKDLVLIGREPEMSLFN